MHFQQVTLQLTYAIRDLVGQGTRAYRLLLSDGLCSKHLGVRPFTSLQGMAQGLGLQGLLTTASLFEDLYTQTHG